MKDKILKIISNPLLLLLHACHKWPLRLISDKTYLKLFFKTYQGYRLNFNSVNTFNEKIQWLKLYDRNPIYTKLTDKYLVREYVKKKIGKDYLIPILGVWDDAKQIDFDKLPNQFVLKCNHDSGSVIICKDKEKFDKKKAIKKLNKCLKIQYFWIGREHNYKDIKRKIIAEKYMTTNSGEEIRDYKFFCFNGVPEFIQVDIGRFSNHIRNYYTIDGEFIPVEYGCQNNKKIPLDKNINLSKMIELSKKLSKGIVMVRVDLYQIENRIYFGELTFHHGGGGMKVKPFKYDLDWGKLIDLSLVKKDEK